MASEAEDGFVVVALECRGAEPGAIVWGTLRRATVKVYGLAHAGRNVSMMAERIVQA